MTASKSEGPHAPTCGPGNSSLLGGFNNSNSIKTLAGVQQLSSAALETMRRESGIRGIAYGPLPPRARLATALRKQRTLVLEQLADAAIGAVDSDDWGDEANVVYYSREAWTLIHRLAWIIVELRQREGRVV